LKGKIELKIKNKHIVGVPYLGENVNELKGLDLTEAGFSYFKLQEYWGVRKPHFGGFRATQELIGLCRVNKGKCVLDVGCGLGVSACYVARKYGCKVVGVDVSGEVVVKAKERAKRKNVEDRVEFVVADAHMLPFKNDLFDIVIGESVLAFLDKQRALSECVRVTKPGGYVGFNEATWVKEPSAEFVEYISSITGAKLETPSDWKSLLENSGLKNVEVKIHKINMASQFLEEMKYIGLKDFVKGWFKFLFLYIRNSAFRKYLKKCWPSKNILKNFYKHLGYGLYVGRK